MSFFVNGIVKVVPLDELNSVTIRKFGAGARQNTISKAGRMTASTQEFTIDFGVMRLEQFKAGVVAWEGPGFDGLASKPSNIDKLIDMLDPAIFDRILEEIDAYNAPLSDDEKKVSAVS